MEPIDQEYFNRLADWAESDAPALNPVTPSFGPTERDATYDLLRRAGYSN